MQNILSNIDDVKNSIIENKLKKLFIVYQEQTSIINIINIIEKLPITMIKYKDFTSNPCFEDICNAVNTFNTNSCDSIIAIGGGSAIDTAKCVKLFSSLDKNDYLSNEKYINNPIPFYAVPATAGTGSEATHFAVIYKDNEKISIAHNSILPDYAALIPDILISLPLYQRKCAFLDAFCQSIESWWSVKSTEESINYSKKSIELLLKSYGNYTKGNNNSNYNMLLGANYSGKAINITQTTAPHAFSYKLSSLFSLPHGYAVAICFPVIWQNMIENIENTIDKRGKDYVKSIFNEIASFLNYNSPSDAVIGFNNILKSLEISPPSGINNETITILSSSVNQQRLVNSPVFFSKEQICNIYKNIFLNI